METRLGENMTLNTMTGMKGETLSIRTPSNGFSFCTYRISGVLESKLNMNTWEFADKFELSILPGGQLGHILKGVRISSPDLAQEFLDLNITKWKKRWGEDIDIGIEYCQSFDRKTYYEMLRDTDMVMTKLKR